ncbi:hypothetical protein A6M21_17110 [Desulfotomaculum copahuensis]|uniref:Uncharacterized protein n=1 Tax=Desulfotomaculum copahuensis TaxID=1838280 RepID=A0A1B7LHP1_9FIRM|nr:hypothetical protein A6M21_17110 [Desulfotomaculum copahuensis]
MPASIIFLAVLNTALHLLPLDSDSSITQPGPFITPGLKIFINRFPGNLVYADDAAVTTLGLNLF